MKPNIADTQIFLTKLGGYKQLIDSDIAEYSEQVRKSTLVNYGEHPALVTDVYLDILGRGGKRVRGALVMLGYEMSVPSTNRSGLKRGKNQHMIVQAARAIEMLHAYMLIMDDIQDRSLVRRGGPTAHVALADYHKKHKLKGDSEHFGTALALNAMGIGNHAAQTILANLPISEELRIKILSITNRTLVITAHGQTNDIMNEVTDNVDPEAVEQVLNWKTAQYSFLNPLHVGMVLADADCHDTDGITVYATLTGKAFQITDDILGIFGSEVDSGKSPLDDIREGKRTVLTTYALEHAGTKDKQFLLDMLGNPKLTKAEFERCRVIITAAGALDYAKKQAEQHVNQALAALDKEKDRWSAEGVSFLRGFAQYLLTRHS